jgi:hypothetical protein
MICELPSMAAYICSCGTTTGCPREVTEQVEGEVDEKQNQPGARHGNVREHDF